MSGRDTSVPKSESFLAMSTSLRVLTMAAPNQANEAAGNKECRTILMDTSRLSCGLSGQIYASHVNNGAAP